MNITNRSSFAKDYVCMGTYVDVWQILDRFLPPPTTHPLARLSQAVSLSSETEFLLQVEFLNLILRPQKELMIISKIANQSY